MKIPSFQVYDRNGPDFVLLPWIKHAYLARTTMSLESRPDWIIDNFGCFEVFYSKMHLAEWDKEGRCKIIISYQIHKDNRQVAVIRPISQQNARTRN